MNIHSNGHKLNPASEHLDRTQNTQRSRSQRGVCLSHYAIRAVTAFLPKHDSRATNISVSRGSL